VVKAGGATDYSGATASELHGLPFDGLAKLAQLARNGLAAPLKEP